MTIRLTQAAVSRLDEEHQPGTQIYDSEAKGLRLVVGKRGTSYKHVGRINDGTDRYVTVTIGRTDEMSLRSARERSAELRLALRRGDDPRRPVECCRGRVKDHADARARSLGDGGLRYQSM